MDDLGKCGDNTENFDLTVTRGRTTSSVRYQSFNTFSSKTVKCIRRTSDVVAYI